MSSPVILDFTIPAGSSVSEWRNVSGSGIFAVASLDYWTPAPIGFDVTLDGGTTILPLYDQGNETLRLIAAGKIEQLNPDKWLGIPMLRLRSGPFASQIVQTAGAHLAIFGLSDAILPNPRRTLGASDSDYIGAFPAFYTTDEDTMGVDLTWRLAPGEVPVQVEAFDLTVLGPLGVADPTPSARGLGTPSIVGNIVSQRFGAWQDLDRIQYEVGLIVATSRGNTLSLAGTVMVTRPPALQTVSCC